MTVDETPGEQDASRTDELQQFARDHPYVAFGGLLIPVTYGITGDPMTALFTGGIVAFGPAIAEGFNELGDDETEEDETESSGDNND
jgi:hypothetical protein